jgi:4-aminobutyrate aminotransferase-like enzyme
MAVSTTRPASLAARSISLVMSRQRSAIGCSPVRAACSSALSRAASAQAEARGLILLSCGTRANVIRLLPPLTIPFEVLEEGLDLLEASIEGAIMETAAA